MSKRYSIAAARANLPSIVNQAEAGREVELTRRGIPVAAVVSLRELAKLRGERARFGDVYKRFLESHPLRQVGLDSTFLRGVRSRDTGRKVKL